VIARLALPRPFKKLLDYRIPGALEGKIHVGSRVRVPLGEGEEIGYVTAVLPKTKVPSEKLRPVVRIYENHPIFDAAMMDLCRWMADFYLCSVGEALHAAAPPLPTASRAAAAGGQDVPWEVSRPKDLTEEQKNILKELVDKLHAAHSVELLWGITGSGKTEVYLCSIEAALAEGMGAICLVPEIALTPQTMARFEHRFGDRVGLLHSRLSNGERYQTWLSVFRGEKPVVLGTRSAVFAPVKRLGLVIIDEEHESSYRQEEAPRYHARETAIYRARKASCPVVLGSATPDLKTRQRSLSGGCGVHVLTQRVDGRSLPRVEAVDMTKEREREGRRVILSGKLLGAMDRCLQKGQQSILFLNRKGYSTFLICRDCGLVLKCRRCDVSLTYHKDTNRLHCHHCNEQIKRPTCCTSCGSKRIGYLGGGTQKVEAFVRSVFPEAVTARMDSDSTSRKGEHARILESFARNEIQILVGTQMIAKGLDFPNVTLVGIVFADMGLNWPHFRAAERTFQLLTQVSGRAGRGRHEGRVLVQTYNPDHYAVQCALAQDYDRFYEREIQYRKALGYPPFRHLAQIICSATSQETAMQGAQKLAQSLRRMSSPKRTQFEVLGPAPGVISKIKGQYLWDLTVLSTHHRWMRERLMDALERVSVAVRFRIVIDS